MQFQRQRTSCYHLTSQKERTIEMHRIGLAAGSRQQESVKRDAYGTYPTLECIIPGNQIRSLRCSIRQQSSKGSHSIRNSFLVLTL